MSSKSQKSPAETGAELEQEIKRAATVIRDADALLIGAGAGMGVDSGLPDFRGNEGFWKAYPVVAKLGLSFADLANPSWFNREPNLAWAFYGHRLNLYRSTVPHEGFGRLLELGQSKAGGYFVYTSNVDGQFQKAGFDPDRILECHGSIHHFQCTRPCSDEIWKADPAAIQVDEEKFRAKNPLPHCKNCDRLARPNVLMFGDPLWVENRCSEQEWRFSAWLNELSNASAKLAVIELGAGTAIASVRFACERAVRTHNAKLVRINPRDFAVPEGQIGLPLGAAEGVRQLMATQ